MITSVGIIVGDMVIGVPVVPSSNVGELLVGVAEGGSGVGILRASHEYIS